VFINELRSVSLQAATVYIKAVASTTTGASFDLTESGNWTYVGQLNYGIFFGAAATLAGVQILDAGLLWRTTTTGTTAASFNDAEKIARWQLISSAVVATRTVTGTSYTVQSFDEHIIADTTANSITITLDTTLTNGKKIVIHKSAAANSLIIQGDVANALIGTSGSLVTSETFTGQYTNIPYVFTGIYWSIYA
jgi:hypothetical protein